MMDAEDSNISENGRPVSAPAGGRAWWPRPHGDRRDPPKTARELRKFALVVSIPLVLLGAYLVWKEWAGGYGLVGIAGLLLALAAVLPGALAPIEHIWMKVAFAMSVVMTYVILSLTFFLVITPVGFLVRTFGRGGLKLRFEPERTSYWEPVEPDGPATRPDRPY